MRRIEASIEINAPSERVWAVLTDFASFPKWNPFIIAIWGDQKLGSKLRVTLKPPGQSSMTFKPNVVAFEPGREFRWLGHLGIPGLFDGEHSHVVEEIAPGRTRYTQGEEFHGIFVRFLGGTLSAAEEGFKQMNQALKKRAEAKE